MEKYRKQNNEWFCQDLYQILPRFVNADWINGFLFENHNVYKNIWCNIVVRPEISIGFTEIADYDSGWKWSQTPWIRCANVYGQLVIYGSYLTLHTKENIGLLIFSVYNIYLQNKCSFLINFSNKRWEKHLSAISARHKEDCVSTYDQGGQIDQ